MVIQNNKNIIMILFRFLLVARMSKAEKIAVVVINVCVSMAHLLSAKLMNQFLIAWWRHKKPIWNIEWTLNFFCSLFLSLRHSWMEIALLKLFLSQLSPSRYKFSLILLLVAFFAIHDKIHQFRVWVDSEGIYSVLFQLWKGISYRR